MNNNIKIFNSAADVALASANDLFNEIKKTAEKNENFSLALSGGSTPVLLFYILSKEPFKNSIEWKKVHLFWADERCVPPDNEESNYGVVKKILLYKINIPEENVHRIKGESEPDEEAERYANEIVKFIPKKNNLAYFDYILLGMGEDGHTASLFPGKKLNPVFKNIAGAAAHPLSGQRRISLTKEVINNAKKISFLVTGESKAEVISKIFDKNNKEILPAGEINPADGELAWYLDKAASQILK